MRRISWCTLYCVLLITLRFELLENLSLSSPKYARYVPLRYVGQITYLTRGCNSCIQTMLLIGTFTLTFPVCTSYSHSGRDCTRRNIMLDPTNMYPESFHPIAMGRSKDFRRTITGYSRTRRPTRYLLIDFGLSRQYDPANGPPLDDPLHGGDRSAPEHQDGVTRCNPFPTDVYYLGNLVRQHYIQVCVINPFDEIPS